MSEFKKCKNGHFYDKNLDKCPYPPCSEQQSNSYAKTEVENNNSSDDKTEVIEGLGNSATVVDRSRNVQPTIVGGNNKTEFWDSHEIETEEGKEVIKENLRSSRKLVGWLVTYSIDSLGIDYKLYEGRNVIGREIDCNITVSDKTMTGKHATILFKNGKYKIKDELSSHGTFVNGKDIEDEHFLLQDGDTITMGQTEFKFKSSL